MTRLFSLSLALSLPVVAEAEAELAYTVEAEQAARDQAWIVNPDETASGGSVLTQAVQEAPPESAGIAIPIPKAGHYRIAVRYWSPKELPASFIMAIRDQAGEALGIHRVDWNAPLMRSRPYEEEAPREEGWQWALLEQSFERPMNAAISFLSAGKKPKEMPRIDCVVVSDNLQWEAGADTALPGPPPTFSAELKAHPPEGMQPGLPFGKTAAFFAGRPVEQQFKLGMQVGGKVGRDAEYDDLATLLQWGVTRVSGEHEGSRERGLFSRMDPVIDERATVLKGWKVGKEEGRFVNVEGLVGREFSLSYRPYRERVMEVFTSIIKEWEHSRPVESIRVGKEFGGFLDHSPSSRERFHQWLEERYSSIATLNERWGTRYKAFSEVALPRHPSDGKAAWFAFREFCGLEYVDSIREKVEAVKAYAPSLQTYLQIGGSHLFGARSMSRTPLDFEDLVRVGLRDADNIGWDSYCIDDQIGAQTDLLTSIGEGKALYNEEWNIHGHDPRIAARSFWTMVGKGVRGIFTVRGWGIQSVWGMMNAKREPLPKLGALVDAYHAIHHLEPFLVEGRRSAWSKPVALYYSRMDLSIEQPFLAAYDPSVNNPFRLYSVLRGLGYEVRWITPRQVEEGRLEHYSALILSGVEHVPSAAAEKIRDWVMQGGCLIGDQQAGRYNEYGAEQDKVSTLFGIRFNTPPVARNEEAERAARLALDESQASEYGDLRPISVNSGSITTNLVEIYSQWDSDHPVARATAPWRVTGYGRYPVHCIAGEVIGMTVSGAATGQNAGAVINTPGKGQTLYVGAMLGSLYDAAPTRFEWDTSREGSAVFRLLNAFLKQSGVQPSVQTNLPERVHHKLRVEAPLVDSKGNVAVAIASQNDLPVSPFELTLNWPSEAPEPKLAFFTRAASRELSSVTFRRSGDSLIIDVPGLDSFATLLFLTESQPLISLRMEDRSRNTAGLVQLTPEERLNVKATIWNPSSRPLDAGALKLHLPEGWSCDRPSQEIAMIPPFGSREATVTIAPPPLCALKALRPLVFLFENEKVSSTPATEVLEWQEVASGNSGEN